MSNFYTGKGDKGVSHVGRKKIKKTCLEIVAVGDLDELNSFLGLAKHHIKKREVKSIFDDIQQDLFIVQAHIAACMFESQYKPPVFAATKAKHIEDVIAVYEKKIPPLTKFVIPGATAESAWCDYARTLVRRAERSVLHHHNEYPLDAEILRYMNRLSTLLFVVARFLVLRDRKKEIHPRYQ